MESANENLLNTGLWNEIAFELEWKQHENVESFLHQHNYIGFRSTAISVEEAENELNVYPDVDGVTIEWRNLAATSHHFHHLFLAKPEKLRVTNVYPWLKKHEDLRKYNVQSIDTLKKCVGIPIFADSGWEYVLSLLPNYNNNTGYDGKIIYGLFNTWLLDVKCNLKRKLLNAIPGGEIRKTIEKNNVNDVSKIFILPGDSVAVLRLFQESVDSAICPQGFRSVIFSFRFGEKNRESVELPISDSAGVVKICVHVGISIEPQCEEESLFWSRSGLEAVIGHRGTLITACSMYECANFRSNLDRLPLDVSGKVRRICKLPERVQFVQMYADVPHCYPKSRYHPVSGAIIIGTGLRSATDALAKDALQYMSEISSNFLKMKTSVCRLEFVTSLPVIPNSISGTELVCCDRLTELLRDHALLVPFADVFVMERLKEIGDYLCRTLKRLLDEYKGTCNSSGVWQAYQYELALEKILWGHPLTYLSENCSVNLGPGLGSPSRSATDQYGFLKLEGKFSSCLDEHSTPPLEIYSRSHCVQRQLAKIFGFSDLMKSSTLVLGRRLLVILLRDLYDLGSVFGEVGGFMDCLKSGIHSLRVVSVVTKSSLARQIAGVKSCRFPMVFLCLLKMLKKENKDIELTIRKGLDELNLSHFPAFRNYDEHRHPGMYWHYNYGVWAIKDLSDAQGASVEMRGNLLCAQVLNELEARKLCYTRSLNGTIQQFPWVTPCLRKLDERRLDEDNVIKVMTFITCVALLEKSQFVEYNKLSRLLQDLPLTQRDLRDLEIQDRFLVNNMNKFMLFRLHHTIPRQPAKTAVQTTVQVREEHRKKNVDERVIDNDPTLRINESEHESQQNTVVTDYKRRHFASTYTGVWQSEELRILDELRHVVTSGTTMKMAYLKYQAECRSLEIADRSFDSFRKKFVRFLKVK